MEQGGGESSDAPQRWIGARQRAPLGRPAAPVAWASATPRPSPQSHPSLTETAPHPPQRAAFSASSPHPRGQTHSHSRLYSVTYPRKTAYTLREYSMRHGEGQENGLYGYGRPHTLSHV